MHSKIYSIHAHKCNVVHYSVGLAQAHPNKHIIILLVFSSYYRNLLISYIYMPIICSSKKLCIHALLYRITGYFCGVLIFVIFVGVTKFSTHTTVALCRRANVQTECRFFANCALLTMPLTLRVPFLKLSHVW